MPPPAGVSSGGLGSGLPDGTKVVRHDPDGDSTHYEIAGKDKFGRYKIKNTVDGTVSTITPSDRAWATEVNAAESRQTFLAEQAKKQAEQQKKADLGQGGMYLSSGYRMINPLLAAFSKAGYSPADVRNPNFDFSGRAEDVLQHWKDVAKERGTPPELLDSWDMNDLQNWYDSIKGINRSWDDFTIPVIPGNTVIRGDSQQIFSSFDGILNPANYSGGGYHDVGATISWPGIMSTTTGSPITHNFVNSKAVIWKFNVPAEGHPGRVLGSENPSEAEVTFPVNTQIKVDRILVREGDFASELSAEFGDKAKVIVFADIVDGGATPSVEIDGPNFGDTSKRPDFDGPSDVQVETPPPTAPEPTAGNTPTLVSPSPDAVTPGQWKYRKDDAAPAPLRTERFDPKADPLASTRPGLLDGWGTLIRTDIRRIQADNGAWVRDLTVELPVKVGNGFDAGQIPALEQHIQDLFDTHVNTGFKLPKSGDQLNIDVKLTPVTNNNPYAVNVSVSPTPDRSDQLNFNLHPPTATPAQKTTDDATLLHEVLHYTGLGDRYSDSDSLFRRGPGKGDTSGLMADVSVLPDGTFPLEYLTQIENTTDSGPVVHDHPLTTTSPTPDSTNAPVPSPTDADGATPRPDEHGAAVHDPSQVSTLDKGKVFKAWAGAQSKPTGAQLSWMWGKLNELARGPELKKLSVADAAGLLEQNGVTPSGMEAEFSAKESAQPVGPQHTVVDDARAAWGSYLGGKANVEQVTFDVPGLGRGEIAMLKNPTGAPAHADTLSWFSHGYEGKGSIPVGTPRRYGFAVAPGQSLFRATGKDVYASLPDTMAGSPSAATHDAPALFVQPHNVQELSIELDGMTGLVQGSDVAVLLDFQWADSVDPRYAEAFRANTPPMAPIIDQAPALSAYTSLIAFTCRTPFSENAPVEGSSKLKADAEKAARDQAKSEGKSDLEVEAAAKQAVEALTAAPTKGKLFSPLTEPTAAPGAGLPPTPSPTPTRTPTPADSGTPADDTSPASTEPDGPTFDDTSQAPRSDQPSADTLFPKQSEVRKAEFLKLATSDQMGLTPSQANDLYTSALGRQESDGEFQRPTDYDATVRRVVEHLQALELARIRGTSDETDHAFGAKVSIRNLGGLNALLGHNGADAVLDAFTQAVSSAMDKAGGSVSKFKFGPNLEFIVVGPDARQSHIEAQLMAAQAEIQKQVTSGDLDGVPHPKHQLDFSQKGSGIQYDIRPIKPADQLPDVGKPFSSAPSHGRGELFKSSAQERRENFLKTAVEDYGLTTSQAEELLAAGGADEVDALTGFDKAADRRLTLTNAVNYLANTETGGVYAEVDLRNLGGLTNDRGRGKADEVYAAMASMAENAVMDLDADVSRFRHGGDEFSFIVVGNEATLKAVEEALTSAQNSIASYVEEQGLSEIEHPKHPGDPSKKGTGIIFGLAPITPATENVDSVVNDILSTADRQVEAKKHQPQPVPEVEEDGPTFAETSKAPLPTTEDEGSSSSGEDSDDEFFDAVSDLRDDGAVDDSDDSDRDDDIFVLAPKDPSEIPSSPSPSPSPSQENTPLESDHVLPTDDNGSATPEPEKTEQQQEPAPEQQQEQGSETEQQAGEQQSPPSRDDLLFGATPLSPDAVRQPPARVTEHQQLGGTDMLVGLHQDDVQVAKQITDLFAGVFAGDTQAATTIAQDFFDPHTLRPTLSALSRGDVLSAPFQSNGYSGNVTISASVDQLAFQGVAKKMEFENGSEQQANLGTFQDVRWRGAAGFQAKFKTSNGDITETFGRNFDSTKGGARNDGGRTIARAKTAEPAAVFGANVKLNVDFSGLKKNGRPFTTPSGESTHSLDIGATVAIPTRDTLDANGEKPVLDKRFAPPQRVIDGRRLGSSDVVMDVYSNGPARGGANAMNEIFSKVDAQGEQYAGSLWPKLKDKLLADLDLTSLQQDLKAMMAGQKTHVEVTGPDGLTTVAVDISASVKSLKHTDNTGTTEFNVGTGVQRSKATQTTKSDNVTLPAPLAGTVTAANPLTFSGGANVQFSRDKVHISGSGQELTTTTKTKAPGAIFDGVANLRLDFTRIAPNGTSTNGTADTEVGFRTLIEQAEAREITPDTGTNAPTEPGGSTAAQNTDIDEITVEPDSQNQGHKQDEAGGSGTSDPTEFVADPTQPLTPPGPRTLEPGSQVYAPPDSVFPSTSPDGPRGGLADTVTVRDVSDITGLHDALITAGTMALGGNWKNIKQDVLDAFSLSKVASRLTSMTRGLPLETPLLSPSALKSGVKFSATAHVVDMEFKRYEGKAEANPVSENSMSGADRTLLSTSGTVQGGGEAAVGPVSAGYTHATQQRDRGGWRDGTSGKISANGKFAQPQALFTSKVQVDLTMTVNGKNHTFTADLPTELSLPAADAKTFTVGEDGRAVFNGPGAGEAQTKQPPATLHNLPERIADRGAISASDVVVSLNSNDTAVLSTIEDTLSKHAGTIPDDLRGRLHDSFDPFSLKSQLSKLSRGGAITEQISVGGYKGSVTVTARLKDFTHTDTVPNFEFEAGSQLRTTSGMSRDERSRTTHGIPVKGKLPHVDISANVTRVGDRTSGLTVDSGGGTGSRSKTVEPAGLFSGTAEFSISFDLKKQFGQKFPVQENTVPVDTTVAVPLRDAPAEGSQGPAPVNQNLAPPQRIEDTHRLGSTDVVTDVFPVDNGTGGTPGIVDTVESIAASGKHTLGSDWPGIKKKLVAELDLDRLHTQLKSMMAGHEIVVTHGRSTVRVSASVSSLTQTGETAQTEFNNGATVQRNFAVTDGVTNLSTGTGTNVTVGAQGTTNPLPTGASLVAGGSGTYGRGSEDISVQSNAATSGVTAKSKLAGTAYSGEAQLIFKMEHKPFMAIGDSNRVAPRPTPSTHTADPVSSDGTTPPPKKAATGPSTTDVLKQKVGRIGTADRTMATAKVGFSAIIEASAGRKTDAPQQFEAPAQRGPAPRDPVPDGPVTQQPVKVPPPRVFDGGLRDVDVMRWLGDSSGVQDILRTKGPEFFGSKTWSRLESVIRNTVSHGRLSGRFGSATRGQDIVSPDPGKRMFVSNAGVQTSMKIVQLEYAGSDGKAELSPANEASSSSQRAHLDWSLFGGQVQFGGKVEGVGAAEGTFLGTAGGSRRERDGTTVGDGGRTMSHAKFPMPMARYNGFAEVLVTFVDGDRTQVESGVVPISIDIPESETTDGTVASDQRLTFSPANPGGDEPVPLNPTYPELDEQDTQNGENSQHEENPEHEENPYAGVAPEIVVTEPVEENDIAPTEESKGTPTEQAQDAEEDLSTLLADTIRAEQALSIADILGGL